MNDPVCRRCGEQATYVTERVWGRGRIIRYWFCTAHKTDKSIPGPWHFCHVCHERRASPPDGRCGVCREAGRERVSWESIPDALAQLAENLGTAVAALTRHPSSHHDGTDKMEMPDGSTLFYCRGMDHRMPCPICGQAAGVHSLDHEILGWPNKEPYLHVRCDGLRMKL